MYFSDNIILERWFLYEPGSVPQKSIAHPFERLVVTPVDPQTYMKQNSINPIDSAVFVQQGRNAGGVNNIVSFSFLLSINTHLSSMYSIVTTFSCGCRHESTPFLRKNNYQKQTNII